MPAVLLDSAERSRLWTGSVIDVDVHGYVPSIQTLYPYLAELWVDWIEERGWKGPAVLYSHYPMGTERFCRNEWREEGVFPASSVDQLRRHVLDPWDVDAAILTIYYGLEGLRHPDWAAALVSALNDWMIAEWLEKEPRLRGTMVLPARDPEAMIREIRRVGDHPQIVQALFPARSDQLWGQRVYHDVYRELAARDIVVGLHYGGLTDGPPSSTGYPAYQVEQYAAEWQSFATQLTSLVSEGVFTTFPDLRVSVLEGGFLWVPVWGWRMNKEWKGLRREVPWLDRPPLDIIRDHFRFSVAPSDSGPLEGMKTAMEWLGRDDLLMFATDYPHRHDDDIAELLSILTPEAATKLMSETARAWYKL